MKGATVFIIACIGTYESGEATRRRGVRERRGRSWEEQEAYDDNY